MSCDCRNECLLLATINTYQKPKRIESVLEALDPEEINFLRNTTFGKIISQAENPSFSGSFHQFVIVRMHRVKKTYEIWFLFGRKTYQDVSARVCSCNWAYQVV
ncbi:hypothetical protein Bca4012_024702 [Brassica carinata]